ncbi:MAG TPA: aspartate carbamoyltransferase catalytic subunit [Candidatus Acidoferrales bacterium]|jgi:aspartate carbamoyltransferase catalytic subunit|nr:aspartate carbamoyltransferase catalytic subunit [Candidatus Acidoferrales bacterium]
MNQAAARVLARTEPAAAESVSREGVLDRFRNILGIESLSKEQIVFLLDQSKPFQEIQRHPLKKLATLRGKTVALAFFEPSTRTRISFATAASRLGADSMNLQAESSSLKKGESLLDTVHTLDAMKPDCIAMRHSSSGAAEFIARHLEIPVINAGDGTHEHPTQALLDALTIRDRLDHIDGLNVTILGDIQHSRVARSNIHLLGKFGCRITLCGPAMWLPRELESIGPPGCEIHRSARIDEAVEGADVVMVLRVQQERMNEPSLPLDEYVLLYQLNPDRLRLARPGALVLHPGPMNRGLEIDPEVADGPQSCVLEQVTNGVAVRMALLFLLMGAPTETGATGEPATETKKDTTHASD